MRRREGQGLKDFFVHAHEHFEGRSTALEDVAVETLAHLKENRRSFDFFGQELGGDDEIVPPRNVKTPFLQGESNNNCRIRLLSESIVKMLAELNERKIITGPSDTRKKSDGLLSYWDLLTDSSLSLFRDIQIIRKAKLEVDLKTGDIRERYYPTEMGRVQKGRFIDSILVPLCGFGLLAATADGADFKVKSGLVLDTLYDKAFEPAVLHYKV